MSWWKTSVKHRWVGTLTILPRGGWKEIRERFGAMRYPFTLTFITTGKQPLRNMRAVTTGPTGRLKDVNGES
jgi:hypothetical protein